MRHRRPGRRPARWTLGLGLAAVALVSFGCTLIGLTAGSVVDARKKKHSPPTQVDGWEVTRIAPGTAIAVILESGERIEGTYAGLEGPTPAAEYGARYAQAQARMPELALPAFGQRVVVTPLSGAAVAGVFVGFQADGVLVQTEGKWVARQFQFRDLATLSAEGGGTLDGARLRQLITDRRIPVRTGLIVGAQRVPFDRVRTVEFRRNRNGGKLAGAAIGLVVDTIVVVWAESSWNHNNSCCSGPLPLLKSGGEH